MPNPLKISIIIGSTRPERFSEFPAKWITDIARNLDGVDIEVLDLRDHPLPFYNEALTPTAIKGEYPNPQVQEWAEKIASADGFIFVTPEYNHGYSAVLKNALDSVYKEWNNKAVGFVAYGSVGGARAVEQLRLVAAELQMASVRQAVHIPWATMVAVREGKVAELDAFKGNADTMLKQLVSWTRALKTAREESK